MQCITGAPRPAATCCRQTTRTNTSAKREICRDGQHLLISTGIALISPEGFGHPRRRATTCNTCQSPRPINTVQHLMFIVQWRYVEMATQFLYRLLRRDVNPSPELARFFVTKCVDPHPTTRHVAQKYACSSPTMFIVLTSYPQGYHSAHIPHEDPHICQVER